MELVNDIMEGEQRDTRKMSWKSDGTESEYVS